MSERDAGSAAFSIGEGARVGNIHVGGNVAGRDVTIGVTPADAAAAPDRPELLALLKRVEAAVAALDEAPAGLKSDAQDELRKAAEAGASGDDGRLSEKLSSARSYLERIGQSLPAALALAQTVAAVAMRLTGVG
ncbi:MAG TPA: hypothetical protein VKV73_29355 [Chloroflexota bacterium]|nr:hypothetical protein [Chloroflexota bacterium]